MAGRIYITGLGTDPGIGHTLTDPIFSGTPTLGACMPNLRRVVKLRDYIFVVSGKVETVQQYVVGGFRVKEKISMLEAYERFPGYRLREENGEILGNIIVNADGTKNRLDHHKDDRAAFLRRVENYIVGDKVVFMKSDKEVERSRASTLRTLSKIVGKRGNRVIDVIGRHSALDDDQSKKVIDWLESMKD